MITEKKLIIEEKCKDMMKYGYQALRDIPKDYRYTLGADIRNSMTNLLQLIVRCGKRYYKKTTLQDMDIELETLRTYIQVAVENKIISVKKYEYWSVFMDEIGRMIGGWIKSIKIKN